MGLPFPKKTYQALDDASVPLSSLDPDTSKLLPARKRAHHVWIQGKLAPVKTAFIPRTRKSGAKNSVLLLPSTPGSPSASSRGTSPASSRFADVATRMRRRSFDDAYLGEDEPATEEERKETVYSQPRGYGIGGAGNIRRPTDVIHGPTKLKASDRGTDTPRSISSESTDRDAPSGLRKMLGLIPDRNDKYKGI